MFSKYTYSLNSVLQVVAKDVRPVIPEMLEEKEAKLAEVYKSCWHPKISERLSMSGVIIELTLLD